MKESSGMVRLEHGCSGWVCSEGRARAGVWAGTLAALAVDITTPEMLYSLSPYQMARASAIKTT